MSITIIMQYHNMEGAKRTSKHRLSQSKTKIKDSHSIMAINRWSVVKVLHSTVNLVVFIYLPRQNTIYHILHSSQNFLKQSPAVYLGNKDPNRTASFKLMNTSK